MYQQKLPAPVGAKGRVFLEQARDTVGVQKRCNFGPFNTIDIVLNSKKNKGS